MDENKKRKILILDDSSEDSSLIIRALQAAGFLGEYEVFSNVKNALEGLIINGFDMAIIDLSLEADDGLKILQEIKKNPQSSYIPVIVLTGSELTLDIKKAYELGAAAYIIKPAMYDILCRRIKALVDFWFGAVELPTKRD